MTQILKPYPAYNDIDLPWLNSIPSHWEIRRGKYLFNCVDIRSPTGEEELLTVSSERGIIPRKSANVTMFKAESYVGYKLCWAGDLVINSLWAWARGLGVSNYHGIISSAYGVYRLKPKYQNYSGFIHGLVRSVPFQWELQVRSKGIWISRLQLTDESFLEIPFPLPPPVEQTAIVRYLNYMDQRINRYIKAKKKLIELLNEQKQAIIHQAVTRGLDPNVRLKPSGVEWLGEIPVRWEVRKLKTLVKIKTGGKDTINRQDDGMYPFFVRSQKVEHIDTYSFDGEAVLTAGDGAGVAKVFHYVNGKFDYHQRVYKFSNFLKVKGKFIFYYLKSNLRFEALDASTKSTVDSLRLPMLQKFPVAIPPLAEQENIVAWINLKSISFDEAITHAQLEIGLLQEYRTRLISDVVTGKLDVRDIAAGLPDEIEEELPEDIELNENSALISEDDGTQPMEAE